MTSSSLKANVGVADMVEGVSAGVVAGGSVELNSGAALVWME